MEKEKPVVSILKGLPPNILPAEIQEELQSVHNLKVLEVKQFVKKSVSDRGEVKLPIYSVKFEQGTKISDLKNCGDAVSKFSCIVERIFEIFE